jgi:transposase-like protein
VIESYKSTYNISRTAAELEVSASFVRTILSQAGFETGMSEAKYRHRFQSYVDRSGGKESCWLWTAHSKTPQGYGWMMYRGRPRRSYWLAWIFAGRPLPTNGLWILHSCGINLCCNPAHLREGTPKDNAQDREMHAKQRGVRIHPRQIPVEFDQKILDGLKQGKSVGRIAKELQITQPTVWRIKKRFENQTSPVF